MTKPHTTAGTYAANRAQALRDEWERRAAPKARLIFWPLIAAGVIGAVLLRANPWHVALGVLIGAGLMGYAWLLEDVPDEVYAWERGAEGERRTAARLVEFEREGWTVVHDVQRIRSNWDHIVVGPPGVFVLETKDRRGMLELPDSGAPVLRIDGRAVGAEKLAKWPRQVTSAAVGLKEEIEAAEGERPWVQGVIVFWGDFPQRVVEATNVTYVHGDELIGWLRKRPQKLTRGRQALISVVIEQLVERGPSAEQRADLQAD